MRLPFDSRVPTICLHIDFSLRLCVDTCFVNLSFIARFLNCAQSDCADGVVKVSSQVCPSQPKTCFLQSSRKIFFSLNIFIERRFADCSCEGKFEKKLVSSLENSKSLPNIELNECQSLQ